MAKDRIRLGEADRFMLLIVLRAYAKDKSLDTVFDCWRLARALANRPKGRRDRWQGKMDSREAMMAEMQAWHDQMLTARPAGT